MNRCECEDKLHDGEYTKGMVTDELVSVKTDYGMFKLCPGCIALGHMGLPNQLEKS